MNGPANKQHVFDNPSNVTWLLRVLYAVCALLLLSDFVVDRHPVHGWDRLTGFFPLFGFVACVALVLIATQLRRLLKRREDYYGVYDDAPGDVHAENEGERDVGG